jgi:hypothetical protein
MTLTEEFDAALDLHGVACMSGPKSRTYYDTSNSVTPLPHDGDGMRYLIRDNRRGRLYCVAIAYSQIDADYIRRHGDEIAELQETVHALTARLANIVRVARGETIQEKT